MLAAKHGNLRNPPYGRACFRVSLESGIAHLLRHFEVLSQGAVGLHDCINVRWHSRMVERAPIGRER